MATTSTQPLRLSASVANRGRQRGSRPLLLFASRDDGGNATAAGAGVTWPRRWLVAFGKARDVAGGKPKPRLTKFRAHQTRSSGWKLKS